MPTNEHELTRIEGKSAALFAFVRVHSWLEKIEGWAALWLTRQQGLFVYWLPVFMAAGIALYFGLQEEPPLSLPVLATLAAVAGCGVAWPLKDKSSLHTVLVMAGVAAAVACIGFCVAQARTHMTASPMLAKPIRIADVTGTVRSVELLEAGKGLRLILDDLTIEKLPPEKTPERVRIKVKADQDIRPGQRVTMRAGLNPPSSPVAPHAFDFQRYAWFRQIGAFGFAYDSPVILDTEGGGSSLAERIRQSVNDRVAKHLTGSRAAMSAAMMTGEVSAVPEDDWEAMRNSGLAHMLALSGTHVGLIAGFVFFSLRAFLSLFPRIALYWPVKKIAAFAAMLAATGFVYVIGPLIPVLRALVMADIVLLAVMTDRSPISMRLLAIAALAVMILMPEAMLGPSFQMSYAAVGGLVLFFEATRGWWLKRNRESGLFGKGALYIIGICATSLVAGLTTAPFSLFHFQQFALYGVLANLMAMPVMSLAVMPMVVVVFLAIPFGLEHWPLQLMGWGIQAIVTIAREVAAMPSAALHFPAWPAAALGCIVLAAYAGIGLRGRARWSAAALMLAACLLIAGSRPPDILVAASGKLMAVRTADGNLALSSQKSDRFTAENWMRLAGREGDRPERWPREGHDRNITCDEWGCRLEQDGRKVAFVYGEEGQAAECAWADIMVSAVPVKRRPCAAPTVIDYFDLHRDGGTAIWLDGRTESVADARGKRLWAVSNTR